MSEIVEFDKAPELSLVEPSKAKKIKETFYPMIEMLEGFEDRFDEVMAEKKNEGVTEELSSRARRLRIDISKIRIDTGKLKDEEKKEYRRAADAIQGVHNIVVWAVEKKENQLKEIEKHFEVEEQKRLDKLQMDRVAILEPYLDDASERDLTKFADDEFEAFLAVKKKAYKDKIAAEKEVEDIRIKTEEINTLGKKRQKILFPYAEYIPTMYEVKELGVKTTDEFNDIVNNLKEKQKIDDLHDERKKSISDLWQFMVEENKNENFGEYDQDMWEELVSYLNTKKEEEDEKMKEIETENLELKQQSEQREQEEQDKKDEAKNKADKFIDTLISKGYVKKFPENLDDKSYTKGGFTVKYEKLLTLSELEFNERIEEIENIITEKQKAESTLKKAEEKAENVIKVAEEKAEDVIKEAEKKSEFQSLEDEFNSQNEDIQLPESETKSEGNVTPDLFNQGKEPGDKYQFGEHILVHDHIDDPENWSLTIKPLGMFAISLCKKTSDKKEVVKQVYNILHERQRTVNGLIKDISKFS